MLRNVVSVLLGLFSGGIVIGLVQALNMAVFPPPPGVDLNDPAALETLVSQMPLGALLGLELSYALGCLAAGLVVARVATSREMLIAGGVGALFTLAGFANLAAVPTPLWLAVLTTVTYIPACLLGARLGGR